MYDANSLFAARCICKQERKRRCCRRQHLPFGRCTHGARHTSDQHSTHTKATLCLVYGSLLLGRCSVEQPNEKATCVQLACDMCTPALEASWQCVDRERDISTAIGRNTLALRHRAVTRSGAERSVNARPAMHPSTRSAGVWESPEHSILLDNISSCDSRTARQVAPASTVGAAAKLKAATDTASTERAITMRR